MDAGMMERDSMVFYRSFYESVEDLEAEDFKKCVSAILQYGLDGIEPEVSGISKTVFKLVKPQIDKNNQRYVNGLKGGKPKANQTETKTKPNVTKPKPNVNVNVNDNVNELISNSTLSDAVKQKTREWIDYKKERREAYKETGLKSLITQIAKHEAEDGTAAVVDVIDLSMSNGWKGIIWDRINKTSNTKQTTFHQFNNKHNYDFEDMEKMLLG